MTTTKAKQGETDGWLAILLADRPSNGYTDLYAAYRSALDRSLAGEKCIVVSDADGDDRVISRSMTKKARRERDRFFTAQQ